jgi:hypothetical protein
LNAFYEGGKNRFQEFITESDEFNFGMPDIERLRVEMKTLIQRLSRLYLPWKEEVDREEKAEKAEKRKAAMEAKLEAAAAEAAKTDNDIPKDATADVVRKEEHNDDVRMSV